MPKTSKKLWEEGDRDEEAEKDRAIKAMGKHPGVKVTMTERVRILPDEPDEVQSVPRDKSVKELLDKIKELTKR
jgi:hypothetical protein